MANKSIPVWNGSGKANLKFKVPRQMPTAPSSYKSATQISSASTPDVSTTTTKLPTFSFKPTISEAKMNLNADDSKFEGETDVMKLSNALENLVKPLANTLPGKIASRGQDTMINIWDKQAGVDKLNKTGRGDGNAGYITDTGSAIGNAVGDTVGFVSALNANTGGGTMQKALSPLGKFAEKGTVKGLEKLAPSLPAAVNKVGKYVLPTIAREGAEGAVFGGTLGVDDGVQGVAREALKGGVENAAFGLGLKGAGDTFSHVLGKLGKVKVTGDNGVKVDYVKEDGSTGTMSKTIFDKEATPLTASPTYKVKNTALEKAQQEYDDAIQTINNHFGTNKLTNEEVASIKPELGIDLEQLTNNLETAKTTASGVGDRVNMARVAGVDSTSFKPVNKTVTEQIPYYRIKRTPVKEELPTVVTYRGKNGSEPVLAGVETNTLKKKDMSGGYKTVEHNETIAEPFTTDKASVKLPTPGKLVKPKIEFSTKVLEKQIADAKAEVKKLRSSYNYETMSSDNTNNSKAIDEAYNAWTAKEKELEALEGKLKSNVEPITAKIDEGQANTLPTMDKPISEPVQGENVSDMSHPAMGATNRTEVYQDVVIGGKKDETGVKQKVIDRAKYLYKHGVDIFNTMKDFDPETHIKAINSKKVGGTVTNIYEKNLVDMEGNPIGESLKSVADSLPKDIGTRKKFMEYVLMKHNIDRAREGKNVFTDWTSEDSAARTAAIEKQNPEWKALNDRLTGFVNKFMDEWGHNSGLISDDLWGELNLIYKNYVPTQREFSTLEEGIQKVGSKGFVDTGNVIKKATGSDRAIKDPMENIMNLVNRVTRTARYNEVGQSVLKKLKADPQGMKKFAEIIPDGEEINPNVRNIVTVIENGKPVHVQVNDMSFLESLKGVYKDIELNDFEGLVEKGTQHFKNLITTDNPFFAIFNGARDFPTAYIFGSEGNPIKYARDYVSSMVDIIKNGESIQRYRAMGGEMGNFFSPSESAKAVEDLTKNKNLGQKVLQGIRGFNNAIEDAPRLAEFNRALKSGKDVQTALYEAGEVTTNFSRGGDWTRKADKTGVPYLNASVQGLDRFGRALKNDTKKTITRSALAITVPTVALNLVNWDNENYKALDNRTKDSYYCIPNITDGGKTFIKLPKSRETGVLFGALTERLIRAARGEENAFKGMGGFKGTVANNFSPVNPLGSNLASPILNLRANKDFADRPIVPQSMQDVSPYNQFDEQTSSIAKALGKVANFSPKQIDYLIKSYTGVIGQFALPMATQSNYETNGALPTLTKPIKTKFTADPLYSSQAVTDFYDNYDMLQKLSGDINYENNLDSETLTSVEGYKNYYLKVSKELSALSDAAKTATDKSEQEGYRKRMVDLAKQANEAIPSSDYKKLKGTLGTSTTKVSLPTFDSIKPKGSGNSSSSSKKNKGTNYQQ